MPTIWESISWVIDTEWPHSTASFLFMEACIGIPGIFLILFLVIVYKLDIFSEHIVFVWPYVLFGIVFIEKEL